MRRIWIVLFLFLSLASRAQEITVRSFKDDEIDFRQYQTFFWASHVDDQLDRDKYFLGDLVLKADIREAVHLELENRGLKRVESNPHLLVNFRFFSNGTVLRGIEGYGRSYWKKNEISSVESGTDEIKILPGTLIISVLDRRTRKLVWQGFASGLDGQMKDKGKVRDAVIQTFAEFSSRTNEYTKR